MIKSDVRKTELVNLYESEGGNTSLDFNNNNGFFEVTMRGRIADREYKRINIKLDYFISEKQCHKVVYNFENLEQSEVLSRAWYATCFLPNLFQKHGKNFMHAIVMSKNRFEAKNAIWLFENSDKLGQRGENKFFDNLEDAELWISKPIKLKRWN